MVNSAPKNHRCNQRRNHYRAVCRLGLWLLYGISSPTAILAASLPTNLNIGDNPTWDSKSLSLDGKTNLLVLPDFHLKTQTGYAIDAGEARTNDANNFRNSRWMFSNKVTFTLPTGSIAADSAVVIFVNNQISELHVTGSPARFEHRDLDKKTVARGTAGVMDYVLAQATVKLSEQAWVSTGQNECRAAAMVYNLTEQRLSAASTDQNGQRVSCTVVTTDNKPKTGSPP